MKTVGIFGRKGSDNAVYSSGGCVFSSKKRMVGVDYVELLRMEIALLLIDND